MNYDRHYDYEEIDVSETQRDTAEHSSDTPRVKPLSEQTLHDFDDAFQRCDGLSYVFLGWDETKSFGRVNTVYPGVFAGIALAYAAAWGADYQPPYTDCDVASPCERNAIPKAEVSGAVQDRVAEMNRRNSSFTLVWNVAGSNKVHVEGAYDMEAVTHLLKEAVEWHLWV